VSMHRLRRRPSDGAHLLTAILAVAVLATQGCGRDSARADDKQLEPPKPVACRLLLNADGPGRLTERDRPRRLQRHARAGRQDALNVASA